MMTYISVRKNKLHKRSIILSDTKARKKLLLWILMENMLYYSNDIFLL